ncbi:hypothetical protein FRC14_006350 [Serendipita sp. 396]|nr:hypothetical protein FRC14_006350 [Serendipita sp. 396]KAG8772054.1 hypothetical protein FRC15_003008 [Serendipita sp. 397]KAG8820181.1 hypothetical protein FRC19_009087 [Serendipita sp. 401]KAG8851456.1 hypothetical protein FRB91_007867 [Serendipita sp. 411]
MFRNVILTLSALLAIVTVPAVAQCTNGACTSANNTYKQCKLSTTTTAAFKACLCTNVFLVNYGRCLNGVVCAWDGSRTGLNQPCITLYCPGTFAGGFDAPVFCATGSTILPTATRGGGAV